MTNIVDTSTETINAEFEAAEQAIGTEDTQANAVPPEQAALEEEQRQAEIAMAAGMMSTSLKLIINSFVGVRIDDAVYGQAAESYAVLIIKYFPGGIFAFLDKFKEEMAAVTATFMLIKVVTEAKAKQQEEEEAKAKAETKKQPASFSPEPSEQGETNGDT